MKLRAIMVGRGLVRYGAALLAGAAACGCGAAATDDCASSAAPLLGGTPEPLAIALDAAQKRAIVSIESSGGTQLCTGTVVAPGAILTAAHCLVGGGLFVRIPGERSTRSAVGQRVHPELDAMLIELDRATFASDEELPALRAWRGPVGAAWKGLQVTLAGTGLTESGASGSLRFVEEPIIDVRDTELWVDGAGLRGACTGDSGGPILVADAAGEPKLAGLLSRGSSDCLGLDAYLRVDVLAGWLDEATAETAPSAQRTLGVCGASDGR